MLRQRLEEITERNQPEMHGELIEAARKLTPHSIELLTGQNDSLRYNCVMFALGIQEDEDYLLMAEVCPDDVHANTKFIHFLVDSGYLVECKVPYKGALIAYSEQGRFRHIGVVAQSGRIRSKWGMGHLYEHLVFEVPYSYGADICYFEPIDRETVLNAFFEFAKRR